MPTFNPNALSTPLRISRQAMAALNGHESSMRLLAGKGANVNPLADNRVSPLALACSTADEGKVRLLLELGANSKTQVIAEPKTSRNAVFANAGESCMLQIVRLMWQALASSTSEVTRGLARRRLAIAEMLIEAGANLQQRCHGFTAVHYASGIGSRRLMTSLLRFGASTSTLASLGINGAPVTALCWAAAYSRPLMVSLLLQAGALEDVDDRNGCCLLGAIGSFAGRMGPVSEEDVDVRSRAVFHALVRGPAFRATSFLWPVAATAGGQKGSGAVAKAPAAAASVEAAAASTAPKASKGSAKRRMLALPRYDECGRRGTPVSLSAMWRSVRSTSRRHPAACPSFRSRCLRLRDVFRVFLGISREPSRGLTLSAQLRELAALLKPHVGNTEAGLSIREAGWCFCSLTPSISPSPPPELLSSSLLPPSHPTSTVPSFRWLISPVGHRYAAKTEENRRL